MLKLLGDIYSDQKQNDKAIEQYNKYIEIKDDNVYLSLGKCYWRKNMFEDALVNMKKSYELYSNSDEVMWYLVRINSVAFEGEIGKILGHVETQFGFHLIYIDNRTDGELPDFEVVVNQVKSAALHDKQQKVYDDELIILREKYI